MKTPVSLRDARSRGFTLIELLVVISIIAILATFSFSAFTRAQKSARLTESLNNAKQISYALKGYATDRDGLFPYFTDPDDQSTKVTTANGAFEALMPKYIQQKTAFINKASAWCRQATATANDQTTQYRLLPSQCDWAYVAGLSDTSDARWPLVATAFQPGSRTYSKQKGMKGGVWEGTDALVIHADCSVKQYTDLRDDGTSTFIKRPDMPQQNMFQPDSTWLAGDTIQILEPMGG